jgi:hypothetical protein
MYLSLLRFYLVISCIQIIVLILGFIIYVSIHLYIVIIQMVFMRGLHYMCTYRCMYTHVIYTCKYMYDYTI